MMTAAGRQSGFVGYLGRLADDTKDFVDEILRRTREIEVDLREVARKALAQEEGALGKAGGHLDATESGELAALRVAVAELNTKVDELVSPGRVARNTSKTR